MRTKMVLVVLFFVVGCQAQNLDGERRLDFPAGQVVGILPVGDSAIGVANLNQEESLPLGPAGLFTVAEGYVVLDNVNRSIHFLQDDFTISRSIDVSAYAVGLTVAVQSGENLVLLDVASHQPALVVLCSDGTHSRMVIETDEDSPPSGLSIDDLGLIVEYAGGERLYRVVDNGEVVEFVPAEGYMWNGKLYSIDPPLEMFDRERTIRIGERTATIATPNMLGSARLLGVNAQGDAFVIVEDVSFTPEVVVEQTIWRIDAEANIIDVSRVPLEEREVGNSFGVAISHDGNPIAMIPRVDRIEFWSLSPVEPEFVLGRVSSEPSVSETPILDEGDDRSTVGRATSALYVAGSGCLTASQMQSNINEYGRVSIWLTSTNISGSCSGRVAPLYLRGAGWYSSVSYDWGGFDTPSEFISAMRSGGKAGNRSDARGLSCSYGVDCSGFVSRVWGTRRLTTRDIPGASYAVSFYQFGDVLNYPGLHVVIFAALGADGIFTYESTIANNYDRVVFMYRTWSSLSGYSRRRSFTACSPPITST